MSKREKKRKPESGADLFSFFESESIPAVSREGEATSRLERNLQETDSLAKLESEIRSFLNGKGGKATKSELYSWAKKKSVPPATVYLLINRMINEGRLRKRFDELSNELTYELA